MTDLLRREADILQEMSGANLFRQRELAEDLAAIRAQRIDAARQDREIDHAETVVRDRFAPVAVHTRTTTESDWLIEASAPVLSANDVIREATKWYRSKSAAVKSAPTEFRIQAEGQAKAVASQYGPKADEAKRLFLGQVNRLASADGEVPPIPGEVDPEQSGEGKSSLPYEIKPTDAPEVAWPLDWPGTTEASLSDPFGRGRTARTAPTAPVTKTAGDLDYYDGSLLDKYDAFTEEMARGGQEGYGAADTVDELMRTVLALYDPQEKDPWYAGQSDEVDGFQKFYQHFGKPAIDKFQSSADDVDFDQDDALEESNAYQIAAAALLKAGRDQFAKLIDHAPKTASRTTASGTSAYPYECPQCGCSGNEDDGIDPADPVCPSCNDGGWSGDPVPLIVHKSSRRPLVAGADPTSAKTAAGYQSGDSEKDEGNACELCGGSMTKGETDDALGSYGVIAHERCWNKTSANNHYKASLRPKAAGAMWNAEKGWHDSDEKMHPCPAHAQRGVFHWLHEGESCDGNNKGGYEPKTAGHFGPAPKGTNLECHWCGTKMDNEGKKALDGSKNCSGGSDPHEAEMYPHDDDDGCYEKSGSRKVAMELQCDTVHPGREHQYADNRCYQKDYDDNVRNSLDDEIANCRHCKSARTRTGKPDAICGPHRERQRLNYLTHPSSETYWTSKLRTAADESGASPYNGESASPTTEGPPAGWASDGGDTPAPESAADWGSTGEDVPAPEGTVARRRTAKATCQGCGYSEPKDAPGFKKNTCPKCGGTAIAYANDRYVSAQDNSMAYNFGFEAGNSYALTWAPGRDLPTSMGSKGGNHHTYTTAENGKMIGKCDDCSWSTSGTSMKKVQEDAYAHGSGAIDMDKKRAYVLGYVDGLNDAGDTLPAEWRSEWGKTAAAFSKIAQEAVSA